MNESLLAEIKSLKDNPLFAMSLSGKELFHSNFLAWIMCDTENFNSAKLIKLFNNKAESGYELVAIKREYKHLDLFLIFQKKENDKYIEDYKAVVIENKFKAIPTTTQLKEYAEIKSFAIPKNEIDFINSDKNDSSDKSKITIKKENVSYAILAPETVLKILGKKESFNEIWQPVSYEKVIEVLTKRDFIKTDVSEKDFFEKEMNYYKDFVNILLNMLNGQVKEMAKDDSPAFPSEKDINELKKYRIHDLYEKFRFSLLLNNIKLSGKKLPPDDEAHRECNYSTQTGLLSYKYDVAKNNLCGIQIQKGAMRIFVEPKGKNADKYTDNQLEQIKNWIEKIGESLKKDFSKEIEFKKGELYNFGNFKYAQFDLSTFVDCKDGNWRSITKKQLEEIVNKALDAISSNKNKLQISGK